MSEALDSSLERVDLAKYIDQLEEEFARILKETGQAKTDPEFEEGKRRIESLLRKLAGQLAEEVGVRGNKVFVFMLMSSVLTTAWTAFEIKRGMIDMTKPFEERLRLEELLSSLSVILSKVVTKSAEHADMYGKK